MTPEAVIFRYLEAAHRQPFSVDAFVRVVGSDADLLGRWLNLTATPAEPQALIAAIADLPRDELISLAQAQAWAVLPVAGSARLGLDQWQSVLRSAYLGEILAEQLEYPDPAAARWRLLLASSGISLAQDPPLQELTVFRGARADLLRDAGLLMRIFGLVEAFEVQDGFAVAELAQTLLGVPAEEFPALVELAEHRTRELVQALAITGDPDVDWSNRLWVQQQVSMLAGLLDHAESPEAIQKAHEFISRSLFGQVPMLLMEQPAGCYRSPAAPDLEIHVDSPASAIAEVIRSGEAAVITDSADLSVGDRQLLLRLGVRTARCLPVRQNGHCQAVLVLRHDDDMEYDFALILYSDALARRLSGLGAPSDEMDALRRYRVREEKRLRELVHEANNPLSVVQNYLYILRMRLQHDASAAEQLEMISNELGRATQIIQRARELPPVSELDPEPQVQLEQFDLIALVRRIHELHQGYAADHQVELSLGSMPGGYILESDPQRLSQILNNLVRNGIEAASGESVTLSVETGIFREGREGVEIIVSDTGPGLPRSVLEQLAEPKESSKGGDHAGLGLHIVHRLVSELGGSIDVRTAAGQGTTFRIFIPLNL